MGVTGIEWTDKVWNPVRGCSPESTGCRNCYAMKFAACFSKPGLPYEGLVGWTAKGPRWNGEVMLVPDKLEEPLHWSKPSRVFVNSMSDLFHPKVPDEYIRDVFVVMWMASKHTFQVLTKRAHRMEQWFGSWAAGEAHEHVIDAGGEWPLQNVWIGVSAENQEYVDKRVPALLAVPAAVRFVSAEPLLGPIDLESVECPNYRNKSSCGMCPEPVVSCCKDGFFNALDEGLDWVIVGCETGSRKNIRVMDESWVRDLWMQCGMNNTAFFYKQAKDGKGKTVSLPLLDDERWSQYPDDRERQRPER